MILCLFLKQHSLFRECLQQAVLFFLGPSCNISWSPICCLKYLQPGLFQYLSKYTRCPFILTRFIGILVVKQHSLKESGFYITGYKISWKCIDFLSYRFILVKSFPVRFNESVQVFCLLIKYISSLKNGMLFDPCNVFVYKRQPISQEVRGECFCFTGEYGLWPVDCEWNSLLLISKVTCQPKGKAIRKADGITFELWHGSNRVWSKIPSPSGVVTAFVLVLEAHYSGNAREANAGFHLLWSKVAHS